MKTLIKNGIVVTMNGNMDMYSNGYVMIEGTKILEVGSMENLDMEAWGPVREGGKVSEAPGRRGTFFNPGIGEDREMSLGAGSGAEKAARFRKVVEEVEVVDAARGIIMPGMVNTHCHMGMIPFRGLGDDCKDRLRVFLLPMESRAMNAPMAAASACYAVSELLLSGVTTVMDMYYFEGETARVMDKMGIRGIAGETVMDGPVCDAKTPEEAISYGEGLMMEYSGHPRVRCCLAPHGTTTCSKEILQKVHRINQAYGAPFTLHAAEMDYEMQLLRDEEGCTPMEYLDRLGVLDGSTLAAHGIHLTEGDLELLEQRGSSVAHCIASNTKAAKGVAPVGRMRTRGIAVGLGTDGPASGNTLDIFTQMRFCANFHKNESRDRSAFPAKEIVEMATIGGARALGLQNVTGSLEAGKEGDIVIVETDSVNMFPVYDPYAALVYSARPCNVRDVYVAGKCLVRDKMLVYEDIREIRSALAECMGRSAFGEMGNLV